MYLNKIKDLVIINIPQDCKPQFEKENLNLSLTRLKILCIAFVILSFYFFYADLKMYTNVSNMEFRNILKFFHLCGFIISVVYLLIYKKLKNTSNRIVKFISQIYILIFLISGSLVSINSQLLAGNIDTYIIFTIIASITFTYEPLFMLMSLIGSYILLMIGMNMVTVNYSMLVSKQINSTSVLMLSIMMFLYLYKHRTVEFINSCKLSKSEADFKKLFSVSPNPLILSKFDDGQILFANQRAFDFYGYNEKEFNNTSFIKLYVDIKDRYELIAKLAQSNNIHNYIIKQKLKNGETKWVIANYEILKYNEQNCILTSVTDITEIKRLENELSNHASIDPLTGVVNRRKGIELLTSQIDVCKSSRSSLVICFVDVDGLKLVNDNYGHSEGDFLLAKVSSVIKNNIRNTDTLFRYGGDEFVIIFPDKSIPSVEIIWNRINLELDALNNKNIKPYKFSASHGLFEYNGEISITIEDILDKADKNMYREKMKKKGLFIGN